MAESRISTSSSWNRYDERGASLILALVFIVVVAVIVGAISSLTLNDLNNTTNFNQASAQSYSASSVANVAIEAIRYAPSPRLRPSCIAVGTVLGDYTLRVDVQPGPCGDLV